MLVIMVTELILCLKWYRVPLHNYQRKVCLSPIIDSLTGEFGKESDKGVGGANNLLTKANGQPNSDI